MHMRKFALLLLIVLAASCGESKRDPIVKAWTINGFLSRERSKELKSAHHLPPNDIVTGANFIDLQQDHHYTAFFLPYQKGRNADYSTLSEYETGTWEVRDENLVLIDQHEQVRKFQIHEVDDKELVLTDNSRQQLYCFKGVDNKFDSTGNNPFAPENNRWRIRAAKAESDAELAARLSNHFRYWEKFFAWAHKNGLKQVDIQSTPSVLDLYGNGFKLKHPLEQLPEWKNAFYDTADNRKAYEKLYYLMARRNLDWPRTESRFEMFESVFQQLQGWMKEEKR